MVDELVGTDAFRSSDVAINVSKSRAVLDEAGHLELDPDLYGEALVHYADTAPIEIADLLAPIVTDASVVPFDRELDPVGLSSARADADIDPEEFDDNDLINEDQAGGISAAPSPEPMFEPGEVDEDFSSHEGFGAGAGALTGDAPEESGDDIDHALDAPDELAFDTTSDEESTWAINELPDVLNEIDSEPDDDEFEIES
jgi:hypothetical protein